MRAPTYLPEHILEYIPGDNCSKVLTRLQQGKDSSLHS